jgi:4-amino-4-deoxy-L-arabinose transferase-like glycosyltransferase
MANATKRWWMRVGAIATGAAVVRLAFVFGVARYDEPLGDQLFYSAQAVTNARGHWFEQSFLSGAPAADHPPLTALLLTPISWITESTGSFVTAQRLMMALIGIVSVVVMAVLARRIAGEKVGLLAAVITAVYANIWVNDGLLMAEGPTFLLVAISTFVAVDVLRRPSNKSAAILGALVGLMALTRSELLLAFPLAMTLVVVAWRADSRADRRAMLRATFAVVMSTLVVLSPWVAWNQARFEDPVYLSTNDGLTLAGANCDSTYYDDVGSWDIWCAYAVDVPDGVDASQESTVMRKAGLEYWSDHIERYPVVAAARMARLLNLGFFDSVTEAGEAEGRPSWVTMLGIVQFWLLVPFAVIGTRTIGDRAQRNVLLAFWPIVIITALVANAYVRFRVPAEVGLVVLAAVGAVALSERRRSVCAKV